VVKDFVEFSKLMDGTFKGLKGVIIYTEKGEKRKKYQSRFMAIIQSKRVY
jgi:hypothetical protein